MNDSERDERLVRMETKIDMILDWVKDHRTLHTRIGIGLFMLLVSVLVGIALNG